MNACCPDTPRWARRAAALALLAGAGAALAAPRAVEAFDDTTWAALQGDKARPAVVVFTTTDCAHCPVVIEQLAAELRQRRLGATLVAVVMDQAPGEDDAALLADAHYRPAARLLAFAGSAAALRHQVQPRWRGVTPFVAFIAPPAPTLTVAGPPPAEMLQRYISALNAQRPQRP
ncbi:hypothetical protein BurJ1DRAFT_0544 [Burkholderiales bacterium JOSHI_001]|nr:hypothetical protein BurJ1DRAFT_0544 [Burkholderiales bacterium JOSHI_001]